jgi:hypothetical protein
MVSVSHAAFRGVGVQAVPHRAQVAPDPLGLQLFTAKPCADLLIHPIQAHVHVLGQDSSVGEERGSDYQERVPLGQEAGELTARSERLCPGSLVRFERGKE